MGLIRLLLALSVVIAHSGPVFGYSIAGGAIAVQSFYIISGFYMTLILREKYIGHNYYKPFIANRILRIYPTYWLLLVLTCLLVIFIPTHSGMNLLQHASRSIQQFISASYPQDNVVNIIQKNIFLITWGNYYMFNSVIGSYNLLIGQSWTLGLEIIFYIIAPFIVRRRLFSIIAFIALSYIVRVIAHHINFETGNNYTLLFFPGVLVFFLLGSLSYYIYKWVERNRIQKRYLLLSLLFCISFTMCYDFFPWDMKILFIPLEYYYYLTFIITIGFIFPLTKSIYFDKILANLSYPIYISHQAIILFMREYIKLNARSYSFSAVIIISSILFGFIIYKFFEEPIDKFRHTKIK